MTPLEALEQAINDSGGAYELSKRLGLRVQNLYSWKKTQVPAKHVLPLERATGVPRHLIRPDLYPPSEYEKLTS